MPYSTSVFFTDVDAKETEKEIRKLKAKRKEKKKLKDNHRPVNILPVVSNLFEKVLFKQMLQFFEDIL